MIKDRNIADDAAIQTQKILGGGGWGAGDIFYVGTAATNAYNWWRARVDRSKLFTTINAAVAKCTANKGDKIIVLPSHAENVIAAGTVALSKAGIELIGAGYGTNRPILTWTATGGTLAISAANCAVRNIQCQNAIDGLVSGISVTAAGAEITGCDFTSPTATNDALMWVLTNASADDMLIQNNRFRQSNAGPTECIRLVGADRARILDNFIIGSFSTAAINGITTASLEILIARNTISNSVTDKLLIDLVAACTGRIEYNNGDVVSTAAWAAAAICDAANCQLAQNYVSDAVGETGKLLGTVSA